MLAVYTPSGCAKAEPQRSFQPHASLLYMGQASLRIITTEGRVIYIDPYDHYNGTDYHRRHHVKYNLQQGFQTYPSGSTVAGDVYGSRLPRSISQSQYNASCNGKYYKRSHQSELICLDSDKGAHHAYDTQGDVDDKVDAHGFLNLSRACCRTDSTRYSDTLRRVAISAGVRPSL